MGKEQLPTVPVIEKQVIKHRGLFDFNSLLKGAPKWFKKHNYDFWQKAHSQKPKGAGGYMEATWYGERKVTEYVKFVITVDLWMRDMTTVAVEKDKKTVKMNKGSVELTFSADMEKDYEQRFSPVKGTFSNFLKIIYEKYIIKSKLDALEDKLLFETQDLIEEMKEFLHK